MVMSKQPVLPQTKYVSVPYIPNPDGSPINPDDEFVKRAITELEGYKLDSIMGSHLSWLYDEWVQIGYYLSFSRQTK